MKLRTKARLAKLEAALPPLRDAAREELVKQAIPLCRQLIDEERRTRQVASLRRPGYELTPVEEWAERMYLAQREV